jgi:hypothetical protein
VVSVTGEVVFGASLIVWFFSITYFLPVLRERLRTLRPTWFQSKRSYRDSNLDAGRWINYSGQPAAAVARRSRRNSRVLRSTRRWYK